MPEVRTCRIDILLPPECVEEALGILYGAGMAGCEETSVGDKILLRGYFTDQIAANQALAWIKDCFPESGAQITDVVQQDWNRTWRESIAPVKITDDIWVAPSWRPPSPEADEGWIRIEPKMAFGTGHHESTRLAARGLGLLGTHLKGARVLDVGTGSGILCFVCAHYGALRCVGVEIDPDARANLAENLRENPSSAQIDFITGTLDCLKPGPVFDVAVANMIRTEAAPLLPAIRALMPSGSLVWSGLLVEERDRVGQIATAAGFTLCRSMEENEWWAGVFQTV